MDDQPRKVVAFGEVLWDLLPDGRMLGGAPFNFVYRTNCLGDRGLMVSRLGRDELGRQACDRIKALGMESLLIQWDDRFPTGTVQVSFDAHGQPDYFIVPDVAYDHVEMAENLLAEGASADCVCFGTLAQRSPQSRRTLASLLKAATKAVKLLDVNLRRDCYDAATVLASLGQADVLKLNEQELSILGDMVGLPAGGVADRAGGMAARCELKCCVVTLGDRGALAAGAGQVTYSPGFSVKVADPVGAGDAFTAGFVNRYLRAKTLAECCCWGNAFGALAASKRGATAGVTRQELLQFLAVPPRRVWEPSLKEFAALQ